MARKEHLNYEQALHQAATLCSRGERCSSDIFDKAIEWGLSEEEAARLTAYLIQERFIDDRRFAHAFVNDKFTYQHWGRVKIRYMLRQKGIDEPVIQELFEELIDPQSYLMTCKEILGPKLRSMPLPLSPNDRARLYRFAAQRGFEHAIIAQAIKLLGDDGDAEE